MKIRMPFFKAKYQAATTTRRPNEYVDEPDMKLSSAFVVVLVLHVVAIGGIYAFNSIKAHQPLAETASQETHPAAKLAREETRSESAVPVKSSVAKTKSADVLKKPAKPLLADTHKGKDAKPTTIKDSGETYLVAKGDNPVQVAKKLHVSYDELLKLNKIDDPKKLQIGQKLRLPAKIKSDVSNTP